jgi:hypothetical protein
MAVLSRPSSISVPQTGRAGARYYCTYKRCATGDTLPSEADAATSGCVASLSDFAFRRFAEYNPCVQSSHYLLNTKTAHIVQNHCDTGHKGQNHVWKDKTNLETLLPPCGPCSSPKSSKQCISYLTTQTAHVVGVTEDTEGLRHV